MNRRSHRKGTFRSARNIVFFIALFALINIIFTMVFTSIKMGGNEMLPTYQKKDSLISSQLVYRLTAARNIQRGSVVVFTPPVVTKPSFGLRISDWFVRFLTLQRKSIISSSDRGDYTIHSIIVGRVIGLPGESIRVRQNIAYIQQAGKTIYNSEFELVEKDYQILNDYQESDNQDDVLSPFYEEIELKADEYFILNDNRLLSNDSRYWGVVTHDKIKSLVLLRYFPWRLSGKDA